MRVGDEFNPHPSQCGLFPPEQVDSIWGLPDGPKRLYRRLVWHSGNDGHCYPSQATLSAAPGKYDRQIRKDITALEKAGLIRHLTATAGGLTPTCSFGTLHLSGTIVPVKPRGNTVKTGDEFWSRAELLGNLSGTDCDLSGTIVPTNSSSETKETKSEEEQRPFRGSRQAPTANRTDARKAQGCPVCNPPSQNATSAMAAREPQLVTEVAS